MFVYTSNADVVKEERACEPFSEIVLKGHADLIISKGQTNQLLVETEKGSHKNVKTKFYNNELIIETNNKLFSDPVVIYITMNELEEIDLKGSGDIELKDKFSGEEFELDISGSGDVMLMLDYKEVEIDIAGSGDVDATGEAEELAIDIKGSGDVDCFKLKSKVCLIDIKGSGDTKVWAEDTLNIKIFGSGDVQYKGDPKNLVQKTFGSGDIIRRK